MRGLKEIRASQKGELKPRITLCATDSLCYDAPRLVSQAYLMGSEAVV
jgi:hypothetical protein